MTIKWIIVCCEYGRLGNRLHTHANILAWCIRNNYKLSNISFSYYSSLFTKTRFHSADSYFKNWNLIFYIMKIQFHLQFHREIKLK